MSFSAEKGSNHRLDSRDASPESIQFVSTTDEGHFFQKSPQGIPHNIAEDDDEVASTFGGLCMESSMDLVIGTNDNPSDASLALGSMGGGSKKIPFHRDIINSFGALQAEHVNMPLVSLYQHEREQDICFFGDTDVNADPFPYPDDRWKSQENNRGTDGDSSPFISSTEPLFDGDMKFHPSCSANSDAVAAQNSEAILESKQQLSDHSLRSNLFVSGLRQSITDSELQSLFSPYGRIESAKVMLDIYTGKSRGIAFVKFEEVASAEKAVEKLNNSVYLGEVIAVRVARPHAAYHPGAPTNKTFVRNVPPTVKKAELAAHFGRYGEVIDISIHSDTAQRSSNKRRNVAFITYTSKEAAAKAAEETHTTMPFPDCNNVPLLAKVAEDSVHRIERLARRSGGRQVIDSNMSKNTTTSNTNCAPKNNTWNFTSSQQNPPNTFQRSFVPGKPVEQQFALGGAPLCPFPPPVITNSYAANPAIYTTPVFPIAGTTMPSNSAPIFFVGSEPRYPIIAQPMPPPLGGMMGASMGTSKLPGVNAQTMGSPQLTMMYPPSAQPTIAPQSTVMYCMPNGQVTLAARSSQLTMGL